MSAQQALFRPALPADLPFLEAAVAAFYFECSSHSARAHASLELTWQEFQHYPDKGKIIVMQSPAGLVGYAIIVNFWSNEYGGNILNIDELYLIPPARNQGIATLFIGWLISSAGPNDVAMSLQTKAGNSRAAALYERLGFTRNERNFYDLFLAF